MSFVAFLQAILGPLVEIAKGLFFYRSGRNDLKLDIETKTRQAAERLAEELKNDKDFADSVTDLDSLRDKLNSRRTTDR